MIKFILWKHFRTILLITFSFLLGCMITINLIPIEKTCRIDDTDREYHIMQNSKLKNPELIILILSAPNNLERRETVRETWLKLYIPKYDDNKQFKTKHYFVIGSLNLTADQLLHLSSEQSKYSDMLILPILDSYKTLANKVKKSFEWLSDQYDYGLVFKYVLKCDDDSFVNLKKLTREITYIEKNYLNSNFASPFKPTLNEKKSYFSTNVQANNKELKAYKLNIYWGYFSGNANIQAKGKWIEKEWIASDKYIPYALGGGYILSKNLISYIAKNSDYLRTFNSEDISVGFWLAPVNNILRIHDIRFDTEWTSRGCQNFYLVTHNIPQQEMKKLYNNFLLREMLCSKEVEKRKPYMYNWTVPPSQCCKPNVLNKL